MGRTVWNYLLGASVAVTIVFGVIASKLSSRKYRVAKALLLSCYAVVLLFYAMISWAGFFVFGGRASTSTFDRLFLIAPMLSPLAMIVCTLSMRWAAVSMWFLFLFVHSYFLWINWPHLYSLVLLLPSDWPLWTTALFLSVAMMQDKRRSGDNATSKSAFVREVS